MPQLKTVVVKVNGQTYLTSTWCGESVDALLQRLNSTHGTTVDGLRLFVLSKDFDGAENLKMIGQESATPFINHFETFNSSCHPWLLHLFGKVDNIIMNLRPSIKSLMERKVVLEYIKKNLSKCLGARVFCIGSSMNNVFLPQETIEVTPFLCKGQEEKWFLRVNEGLCADAMASGGFDNGVEVSSVSFDCKAASISATVNGMKVNIVHNELVALYNGALLEDISHMIGKDGLVKRSLLLIKSWCFLDTPQYTQGRNQCSITPPSTCNLTSTLHCLCISRIDGKELFPRIFPPRVLHILVLHLFCLFGDIINHPLNALVYFLFYYGNLNWQDVVITLGKPLSPIDMSGTPFTSVFSSPEVSAAVESAARLCARATDSPLQKIDGLIFQYRCRYETTIAASTRAKEEDLPTDATASDTDVLSDERSIVAPPPAPEAPDLVNVPAWGMASARPSLTPHYQPPDSIPHPPSPTGFNRSHMNVADSLRPAVNITADICANDVEQLTQVLRCGLRQFAIAIRKCDDVDPVQYDAVSVGMQGSVDIATLFLADTCGNTCDAARKCEQTEHCPDETEHLQELKRSKFFCESEDPEAVMRHAELIMGSKVKYTALPVSLFSVLPSYPPCSSGTVNYCCWYGRSPLPQWRT